MGGWVGGGAGGGGLVVPNTRQVLAGAGLTGGGALDQDVTLSLADGAGGAGEWLPLVVWYAGGATFQFTPVVGQSAYAGYGPYGSAGEGTGEFPLARAQTAGKMLFRLEYTNDSTVQLRMRRRRADTDSWARFESNLVRYRNAASRNNSNLPIFSNWTTNNPVALVASDTWCWYEVECTTLPEDEISMHFYPNDGVVNWGYLRIYVKI